MNDSGFLSAFIIMFIIAIPIVVFLLASMWKVYKKAGYEGWECIVPIYNIYILCKIAGKNGWWVLWLIIPYIGIIFHVIVNIEIAKKFGKSVGFGIGLVFLSFIFWPILGFGDAIYQDKKEISIEDNLVE